MIKASIVYLFSSVFSKSVPFLLLPFLTSYLSPTEFGLVAIFQLLIHLGQAAFGMAIQSNIPRNYFSRQKEDIAILVFNILVVLIASFTIFTVIVSILFLYLDNLFELPIGWILAMPIFSFMGMVNLINLTLIRTMENPVLFFGFEVGQALMSLLLTLFFMVFLSLSWEGRALGVAIPLVAFGILGFYSIYTKGFCKTRIDVLWIKDVLAVSIPLIPHAVAGVIITVSDRIFIEKMVGMHEVGIYSVGYYFGMVVMLFSDAFVKAWSPWFFKVMSSDAAEGRNRIVKYTYLYAFSLVLGALIYSVLAVWIFPFIVSDEYYSASTYIPWICLGYVFFGIYQIFFPYLVYCKKTQFVAVATVSAACVNLIGNYYLIGWFGTIGAAYSTIISFALSALAVGCYSTHFVRMPWYFFGKG